MVPKTPTKAAAHAVPRKDEKYPSLSNFYLLRGEMFFKACSQRPATTRAGTSQRQGGHRARAWEATWNISLGVWRRKSCVRSKTLNSGGQEPPRRDKSGKRKSAHILRDPPECVPQQGKQGKKERTQRLAPRAREKGGASQGPYSARATWRGGPSTWPLLARRPALPQHPILTRTLQRSPCRLRSPLPTVAAAGAVTACAARRQPAKGRP